MQSYFALLISDLNLVIQLTLSMLQYTFYIRNKTHTDMFMILIIHTFLIWSMKLNMPDLNQ